MVLLVNAGNCLALDRRAARCVVRRSAPVASRRRAGARSPAAAGKDTGNWCRVQ